MKNSHRLGIALGIALSFSSLSPGIAADHAAIIAALPDEASACRYYLNLCQSLKAASEAMTPLLREVHACNQVPPTCATPPMQWVALAARGKEQNQVLLYMMQDVAEVIQVMQAKYPQRPACMATGKSILDESAEILNSARDGTPHP